MPIALLISIFASTSCLTAERVPITSANIERALCERGLKEFNNLDTQEQNEAFAAIESIPLGFHDGKLIGFGPGGKVILSMHRLGRVLMEPVSTSGLHLRSTTDFGRL